MKSLYFKLAGCVVFVLLFVVGVVVFWPGGSSEPVDKGPAEAVAAKADAEAKRKPASRPSIKDIEIMRAWQTGVSTAARANPEAERLYIMALRHSKAPQIRRRLDCI